MGRVYGKGKGISKSVLPYQRKAPKWFKMTAAEIEERIVKLAKRGIAPSQIGGYLRDQYCVGPRVVRITGNKILRVLKCHGMAPEVPEDLERMKQKRKRVRDHLKRNRADVASKFRLLLVDSRIHRLVRYYKRVKQLPASYLIEKDKERS